MNHQKGISSIVIILIIVGVLVIGGVAWYYQKTLQIISQPTPQITPPDETANWKTYRNEEYGFEVKYPPNWIIKEESREDEDLIRFEEKEQKKEATFKSKFVISIHRSFVSSFAEWEKQFNNKPEYPVTIIDKTIKAREMPGMGGCDRNLEFYYNGWEFAFMDFESGCVNSGQVQNLILSTFKFIEKIDTTNWKTYRNEKYGFELKYLTDWQVAEGSHLGGGIPEKGEVQFAFTSPDFTLDTGVAFVFSIKPTSFQNNQEFLLWRRNIDESNPNTKGKWVTKEINFFNIGQAVEWDAQTDKTIYIVKAPYLYQFPDYRTNSELSKIMGTFKFISKDITANWKTYRNDEYAFELKYPSEYTLITGWRWGEFDIHFIIASQQGTGIHVIWESVYGIYCMEFLCDKPAKNQLFVNNVNWDYLGLQRYCDVGECSPDRSVYRTTHGNYRYYILFDKETPEKDVLQTFKFVR